MSYDSPTQYDVASFASSEGSTLLSDAEATTAEPAQIVDGLGSDDISNDILVGVVGGGIAFITIFVLSITVWLWRRKKKRNEVVRLDNESKHWQQLDLSSQPNISALDISPNANGQDNFFEHYKGLNGGKGYGARVQVSTDHIEQQSHVDIFGAANLVANLETLQADGKSKKSAQPPSFGAIEPAESVFKDSWGGSRGKGKKAN